MSNIALPILTVLLLLGFLAIILDNSTKDGYWENVGPQWACVLNPAKYPELCKERE